MSMEIKGPQDLEKEVIKADLCTVKYFSLKCITPAFKGSRILPP